MKKVFAVLVSLVLLLAYFPAQAAPSPLRLETLMYRLLTRAPLFYIELEEPELMSKSADINSVLFSMSRYLITFNTDTMLVHSAGILDQPETEERVLWATLLINCLEEDEATFNSRSADDAFKAAGELLTKLIPYHFIGQTYRSEAGFDYFLIDTDKYTFSALFPKE